MKEILRQIIDKKDLGEAQMTRAMDMILAGEATPAQIGALMTGLAAKGETFGELAGAARALRKHARPIQIPGACFDTCGTGGDGLSTFNISTVTAFVAAAGGIVVAKHGNRSVSSACGSADVLEALGVNLATPPEQVEEIIQEIGIGFLFAPTYHGAMAHAAGPRKETGIRSIFNMVGPLTNPAGANAQLLGVFAPELTEMFAQALDLLGSRRAMVVHGHDGLDEISVCAPTRVTELRDGCTTTFDLDPERFFDDYADPEELRGGGPEENAAIARAILSGKIQGPKRHVVLINAAAAFVTAEKAPTLEEGLKKAEECIASGAALDKLDQLIHLTGGQP